MTIGKRIAGNDDDDDIEWVGAALESSPGFYFFVRVWLACIIEYAARPSVLMAAARQGDEKAIERLVRLDDLVVQDPAITDWINGDGGKQRIARLELVHNWIREGPIGQNHYWHFKQSIAGVLSSASRHMFFALKKGKVIKQALSAPQIMQLFDALYRDQQGRKEAVMKDPDFARVQPGSWSKAVSRYRKLWDQVFGWGE